VWIWVFHKVWLPWVSFLKTGIKLMVVMMELDIVMRILDPFGGDDSDAM
jgi:hypothetical protein